MVYDKDMWYFTKQELEKNSPSRSTSGDHSRSTSGTEQQSPVCFLPQNLTSIGFRWTLSKKKVGETLEEVFEEEVLFNELKEIIIKDEREILIAINFDMDVDHPYKYFVKVVEQIKDVPAHVRPVAVEFMDNHYLTSLCLQFKPQKIAGAVFHLTYKFLNLKLPFQEEDGYSEFFQMTPNELEDISSQILDLYEYRPPPQTAPSNQSAPSSSQPGNENHSATASTSAPPPLFAAHGNRSPPPAAALGRCQTVLNPRPPAPGKESFGELMPPPRAPGKRSLPVSPHPPVAHRKKSSPPSSPLQAVLGHRMPPSPAAISIQIPPQPAVPTSQSPPPPAAPGSQSRSAE